MTERVGHDRGRVIVAGGSIAGLFAGALLHRLGFAVDVFERSREALASRGAGIVSHPELFDVLRPDGSGDRRERRRGGDRTHHPGAATARSWASTPCRRS